MSGLLTVVIRVLLAAFTLVLVLGLLAVAAVTMLGLLIWSLLRGRKPEINVSGFRRASQFRPGQQRQHGRSAPTGDVVDVEAREVKSATPRLDA